MTAIEDSWSQVNSRRDSCQPAIAGQRNCLYIRRMYVVGDECSAGFVVLSPLSIRTGGIHCPLGLWEALKRYCDDGRLEIDNNRATEQEGKRRLVFRRAQYSHVFGGW